MFKVNIVDQAADLSNGADKVVESAKQLLLEANTQENAVLEANTQENAVLAAAGLNKQSAEAHRLKDEGAKRLELRMRTGSPAVLTLDEIRDLCIRYRLRFLPSNKYAGPIDPLLGAKILRFFKDVGEVSPQWAARDRLFIMAPRESFRLTLATKPVNPVLFYRDPKSGLYTVVHKWGNDFTILRRVEGWLTASALRWRWFMFCFLLLLGAGGGFLMRGVLPPVGSIACVAVAVTWMIARLYHVDDYWAAIKTFSRSTWDSHEVGPVSLLWL